MTMVNIREYYEKDGKSLPGKQGINMPIEQFNTFMSLLPQVFEELEEKGVEVKRPKFGTSEVKKVDEDDEDDQPRKKTKSKKSNIEATSDEDEDD